MTDPKAPFEVRKIQPTAGVSRGVDRRAEALMLVGLLVSAAAGVVMLRMWAVRDQAASGIRNEAEVSTWTLCTEISNYTLAHTDSRGKHLLPPAMPLTPATPPGRAAITVPAGLWRTPAWTSVGFEILGPHHFSYSFTPTAYGGTVQAIGDPDGDGERSVVERTLTLSPEGYSSCDPIQVRGDSL